MNARAEILGRIRDAIAASSVRQHEPGYRRAWEVDETIRLDRFIQRLKDYGVEVLRAKDQAAIAGVATERMAAQGVASLLVPPGLPVNWRPVPVSNDTISRSDAASGHPVSIIEDDGQSAHELDRIDGVMTGCAVAIAETGSIVLDGGPTQGRRAVSLVPDYHLCVVLRDQLVGIMPEAIARLADAARSGRPITFISGPSATADIELQRVAGVHGPRRLEVMLVD